MNCQRSQTSRIRASTFKFSAYICYMMYICMITFAYLLRYMNIKAYLSKPKSIVGCFENFIFISLSKPSMRRLICHFWWLVYLVIPLRSSFQHEDASERQHLPDVSPLRYSYSYGNEYEQAHRLFNLTTKFDAADYFNDYNSCSDGKCQAGINAWHRKNARLWNPSYNQSEFDKRLAVDCSYHIQFDHAVNQILPLQFPLSAEVTVYHFTLVQSGCSTGETVSFHGGSTFDITAQTAFSAVACTTRDSFDNQYSISCSVSKVAFAESSHSMIDKRRLSGIDGKSDSDSDLHGHSHIHDHPHAHPHNHTHDHGHSPTGDLTSYCFSLTIVLNYEHFDGYSEVITDIWDKNKYYPLQRVLVDNVTYCPAFEDFKSTTNNPIRAVESTATGEGAYSDAFSDNGMSELLDRVSWYTGIWSSVSSTQSGSQSRTELTNKKLASDLADYIPAWTYSKSVRHDTNFTEPFLSQNRHLIPSITVVNPSDLADRYSFLPLLHHPVSSDSKSNARSLTDTVSEMASESFSSSLIDVHDSDSSVTRTTSIYDFEPFIDAWSRVKDKNNEYYFIGASHMRYFFDATAIRAHGVHTVDANPRKHGSISVGNLHFEWLITAEDQAAFLPSLCQSFNAVDAKNVNRTIVFQTGSHDLAERGVRSMMHNPVYGPALMTSLRRLIEGNISCSGVTHFIWVTSAPYPELYSHYPDEPSERFWRGYRNNPAIAAGNTHYLRELNHMKLKEGLQVSVIDMYSIVMPRILFNEQNELLCTCHFLCMIQEGAMKYLSYTPAGLAVLRSLWAALF